MADETTRPDLSSLRINREVASSGHTGSGGGRSGTWLWIVAGAVVIAIAIIFGMRSVGSVATVQTATVQRLNPAASQSLLTATGYVVAQRKAAVASKGTGRLEVLNVEEGDRVKAGDILARLEADDVTALLRAAHAATVQAEAELASARVVAKETALRFERATELLGKALISQAEFDSIEATHNSASAAVNAADAALKAARANADYAAVQVENTYIRAPFDGTVLTKDADVGEVVAPFASSVSSRGAVVTLADMNSLEVEADVSESNIQRVHPGQPCVIVLDALPSDPYRGRVKKIVPTADRAKATVMTKIAFVNLDERVLPEMSAKVSFLPNDADTSSLNVRSLISIPVAALTERNGESVVFVVQGDQVLQTGVTIGQTYGGSIEIKEGLQVGDVVVLRPPNALRDGDRIEIQ